MNTEKALIKRNALNTPGIVSMIASHMDVMDQGLKGLFLLVNEERYRHELEPFVRSRAKQQAELDLHDLIHTFYHRVFSSLQEIPFIVSKRKRCKKIIRMYEFICSQEETVKLFPILFRETIYNKLNDLHREIQALDNLKDSYKEYVFNRFTEFRTSLQKLI